MQEITRAHFDYKVVDGVLCIIDLDIGATSVTNDIENVLRYIKRKQQRIFPISVDYVIYRDSEKNWDQIIFDKKSGDFKAFETINTKSQSEAINFVKNEKYIQIIE